ncbi:peptidase M14 [Deinococcus detaillensis]|uniref:Peptidase M14 n=1 Tax=Deinococcus detaillensis TaxID=2592048 RepID=A0A553UNF1_9DEIO|nr:M14 family metallopeptidase [Deinococcus detaillensis]TSA81727.1 peptidase M14 [Deinococcus detaillensis]
MHIKVDIAHDRYYPYDELTAHLQALANAFPQLCQLASLGQTFGGREIWCMTITNQATGPDTDKPAYYIDAHIHAEEHATSATALYAAWYLLHQFGQDDKVSMLLNEQAFYILPRLNPDGAEYSLAFPFRWCGNGRFVPGSEDERSAGFYQTDLNDDGYIVQMRVRDPAGEWKISALDARVMVQRGPGEFGGEYYRLYPEGLIPDYDGVELEIEPTRDGNLNRQFPAGWMPETVQYGAGLYPGSEPESRALIEFILGHPNICGMNSFHTHGGLHLRPSTTKYDHELSARDLTLFKDLGAVALTITDYPTVSSFQDFTPDKSKPRRGTLKDWAFEELGIPAFATELWDIEKAAGIEKVAYYNLRPRDEAALVRTVEWVWQHHGERGWREWEAFDHPQLGSVELGGLADIWVLRNPPGHLLEEICHKNTLFCLEHAAASPRIRIRSSQVEQLGTAADGAQLLRISAVIGNDGYLPSNLTDTAIAKTVAQPVQVELEVEQAEILMGQPLMSLGHLAGRNGRKYPWSPWGERWNRTARPVEWLVKAQPGADLRVVTHSQKGGKQSAPLSMPAMPSQAALKESE